ncbi:MAG: glutamine--fructose-6-phosphate transaminase (isomerizing) [Candidatus Eisenbacteria bacterium]|nr:glutamine--fructose-6-phosphate transaminase (isomerizing) [Candidatus Eisenbacteria bacterium]
MCGIIGYVGWRPASPILINGLRRLEYRGYDSAGVAIVSGERLEIVKDAGKIGQLAEQLARAPIEGTVGIAHTRWATHGVPSRLNAHPHTDPGETIAVVHNGIVENFYSLKKRLIRDGAIFQTDTDTEVFAHLIARFYNSGPLEEAVQKALHQVTGAYGLAVVSSREPDKIVGARNGSPLVVGIGEGENFVASDPAAILEHTRQMIYLADREMAVLKREGVEITNLDNVHVERKPEKILWDLAAIEKGGYDFFMQKEICEQPRTIRDAMSGRVVLESGKARLGGLNLPIEALQDLERIVITACGTSWHAGLIGEYMIEDFARIPVEVEYASEFRYRRPIVDEGTLVIVISQSGETIDTLAALREAQRNGARVLGICNVVGSTIARESNGGVYLHAGPEIGVASTKAFTSQVTVLAILSLLLGRVRGTLSRKDGRRIIRALLAIPDQVQSILDRAEEIHRIADLYAENNNVLYLGRGYNFPVALEGALKLKEISYIHAEGYPAAEMKHGPIALIDRNMPVVFIALRDSAYEKVIGNIQEVKSRQGRVLAIATEGDDLLDKWAEHVIYLPPTIEPLTPILSVIPLQLLAYYIAVKRGCNVDQPRNLAKSVTVE